MSVAKARRLIYLIWGGALLALLVLLEVAPSFRDGAISPQDAHNAFMKLAALYTPVIAAFMTFWFRQGEQAAAANVPSERWFPAVLTSVVFQIVICSLVGYAAYGESYENEDPAISFDQWITNVMQIGLFLSPIATAPAAYFLGIEKIEAK